MKKSDENLFNAVLAVNIFSSSTQGKFIILWCLRNPKIIQDFSLYSLL